MNDYKTTDYCARCGESPDSGSHLPHGHEYVPPWPHLLAERDAFRATITRLTKERDEALRTWHCNDCGESEQRAARRAEQVERDTAERIAAFAEAKSNRWRLADIIAAIRALEWKEPKP